MCCTVEMVLAFPEALVIWCSRNAMSEFIVCFTYYCMHELFYTFVIFFSPFLIVIVMRFIHEPLGNPLPRYGTNKLIDWLRYNKCDLFFFLSIELLHRIFSWFVLSNQKFVYAPWYNSKVSTRKVMSTDQRNIVNYNLLCYWLFRQFWQHNWWTSFARWGGGWGEKKWRESIHSSTDPTSKASNQWQTVLSHPMGGFQAMHAHQIHMARPS